jgi:hypothetical protein
MLTFSNPRQVAVFMDWPLGNNKQGKCVFQVETNKKGSRASRTIIGKPKYTKYSRKCTIVDGSNGRPYILQLSHHINSINIIRSDFMTPTAEELDGLPTFISENSTIYDDLLDLIQQAEFNATNTSPDQ